MHSLYQPMSLYARYLTSSGSGTASPFCDNYAFIPKALSWQSLWVRSSNGFNCTFTIANWLMWCVVGDAQIAIRRCSSFDWELYLTLNPAWWSLKYICSSYQVSHEFQVVSTFRPNVVNRSFYTPQGYFVHCGFFQTLRDDFGETSRVEVVQGKLARGEGNIEM